MNKRPVLMGVFAHPDDESFGPGGTLARYAHEGAYVHVVIATDGIAGSVADPAAVADHETLAQARSAELANAAVALGVTAIWSLPYRDSGMRNTPANQHPDALIQQPLEQVIDQLLEYMQRLQPDVVITHGPFGGYGHPDHVRVYEATTQAFYRARETAATNSAPDGWRGPQKLYYTAMDKRWLKVIVRLMPLYGQDPTAIGRNKDIDLVEISRWETPVHARIDVGDYLIYKQAASHAHVSQYSGGPGFWRILPAPLVKRLRSVDTFSRAFPPPNGRVESDLFAGVK